MGVTEVRFPDMRLLSIQEAERSADLDVKMVAGRASRYRLIGSVERIPDSELVVVDLRESPEPADFAQRFQVLERHPISAIVLARKIKTES